MRCYPTRIRKLIPGDQEAPWMTIAAPDQAQPRRNRLGLFLRLLAHLVARGAASCVWL